MASGLGYGSFPFPDSGKQSEDIPAADFSTDSPELWKEPEALSTRNSGKDRMEPFSQWGPSGLACCALSVLPWLVGEMADPALWPDGWGSMDGQGWLTAGAG